MFASTFWTRCSLAALIVSVLALVACAADDADDSTAAEPADTAAPATSAPDAPPATTAAPFPITIEHALGSTEIPAEPLRIVSASGTMTGHLLAIDAPVVAAQVLPRQSPLADENGFLRQWGSVAAELGVEPIAGPEVNVEAIAAAEPDLIVGNSFGSDAVTGDVYALLSDIAPTIVIDHSAMQWQELAGILATATGRQDEADAAVATFASLVDATAPTLDASHPVVAGVITADGLNMFTDQSSHGRLLESLGLTLVSPEGGALSGETGAGTRSDVVSLSAELVPDEFGDATVLFVFADEAAVTEALDIYPTLAATPAASEGRLVPLGFESFRLDVYSATMVVETLATALA
jgi:ABC-type Fe2+-enterobactin transport system substrate-binding protein